MAFEAMFQPIQIGKLTIRNRVLSTAHAEVYATDGGMTTERYVKYYEEKAKGGIGLAICGGSSVVAIDSPQQWWSSVNLSTDRIIPHFQNLADAMQGGQSTAGIGALQVFSTQRACPICATSWKRSCTTSSRSFSNHPTRRKALSPMATTERCRSSRSTVISP